MCFECCESSKKVSGRAIETERRCDSDYLSSRRSQQSGTLLWQPARGRWRAVQTGACRQKQLGACRSQEHRQGHPSLSRQPRRNRPDPCPKIQHPSALPCPALSSSLPSPCSSLPAPSRATNQQLAESANRAHTPTTFCCTSSPTHQQPAHHECESAHFPF